MSAFEEKVKNELKEINERKPVKNSAEDAYRRAISFGDRYNQYESGYNRQQVCYLLRKFPPCKTYNHSDGCTGYLPTNRHVKTFSKNVVVKEVNPVLLWCDGLDSYIYTLAWYTRINKTYFKVEVVINYGHELVKIKYKYNDLRRLPKYSNFKAYPVTGLKAIMYYGDSGEHMTKFAIEAIDKKDIDFFITQGE